MNSDLLLANVRNNSALAFPFDECVLISLEAVCR